MSFSQYFSRQQQASTAVSNNFLFSMLEESINSPAMILHCVKMLKLKVSKVNPHQITVS